MTTTKTAGPVEASDVEASLMGEQTAGREYHYQADWSVGTRMFHVRFDDFAQFKAGVRNMETILPSDKSFPEDTGNVAHTATETPAPECPVHGTPMKWIPPGVSKMGKQYAGFWACGTKNSDGTFCKARPTV